MMKPATPSRIAADGTTCSTFLGHLSCLAPFVRLDYLGKPSPVTQPGPAAPKSAAASLRTGFASDGSQPARASSTGHDQLSARLDEALLETGQRPGVDPRRQPPPQVAEVVCEHAQLQPEASTFDLHPDGERVAMAPITEATAARRT